MHRSEKKFPPSKSGKECVSGCFFGEQAKIHPHTQEYTYNDGEPFCFTRPYLDALGNRRIHDDCFVISNGIKNEDQDQPNLIDPSFNVTYLHFLRMYYKIMNLEDALEWVQKNNRLSIYTRKRVFEAAIITYRKEMQIIDDRMINFYTEIIKRIWYVDIYKLINRFIVIGKETIYFEIKDPPQYVNPLYPPYQLCNIETDTLLKEKYNFIISKVVTPSIIYDFLSEFILGEDFKGSFYDHRGEDTMLKYAYLYVVYTRLVNKTDLKK